MAARSNLNPEHLKNLLDNFLKNHLKTLRNVLGTFDKPSEELSKQKVKPHFHQRIKTAQSNRNTKGLRKLQSPSSNRV